MLMSIPKNNFSTWLEQQIKKRKMSQARLAEEAGVTRSAINKVIKGKRNPGYDMCNGVAKAFNMTVDEVYREAGLLPDVHPDDALVSRILYKLDVMQKDPELKDQVATIEAFIDTLYERFKKN